jgi:acyl-ACP thioesterase
MGSYVHTQEFKIKYCEVDFKDEMKVSTCLSLMEEVACSSADELGFGYSYVKAKGCAFMVTNICLEFLKPIRLGEVIKAQTWPLPPSYVVFGREYQFLSQTGEPLMRASSRWCLIDMATGKLLQSKVIDNQDYSTYNTAKVLESVQWKIPAFEGDDGELRFSLLIANSEYDHNMHVNNTRYADYCMNCFTIDELQERAITKFSIAYIKQCREGETLSFYRKKITGNEYVLQGFNEQGEKVVQAQVVFDK